MLCKKKGCRLILMGALLAYTLGIQAMMTDIDENGNYFINDFERNIPESSPSEETSIYVEGQGEWLFLKSFVSTNTSYVRSGKQNLRLYKNGSYIITPVLNKGVKAVNFYVGRKGKGDGIEVYTSTDAGRTWSKVTNINSTGDASIDISSNDVNRIKISNDSSGDADIDDLVVSATAFGIEAKVSTLDADNITKNTADLSGTIIERGDQPTRELGIVWGTRANPTIGDNKVEAEDLNASTYTVTAIGLKASTDYHYRAYAISNAGTAYGEDKTFRTSEATMAVVNTGELTSNGKQYECTGTVTDDGGADLMEVGIIYGDHAGLTENDTKEAAKTLRTVYRVVLPLEEGKTYYFRAYAITAIGTSLGEEKTITIDDNVPPTPDLTEKIWCAPDGDDSTADGTEAKPFFSLDKAIALVEPGTRICMKAGTYVYDHRINIDDKNGTEEAPIELFGVGGRAVLDFSGMPYHKHSDNPYQGVRLTSSYWHFYHIDICNASDNGLLIERNKPSGGSSSDIIKQTHQAHDNIIEECNFYKNGDTGLQIKNLGAFNKIINCDSYLNCDEGEGDADGFAPKISVGDGNYFYGCRAYLNSDDGWDVFYKKEGSFGDNMTIIMENCISYKNGFLDENTIAPDGNGNGFKCGSDQGAMNVFLNRCLAICNKAKGFDQNHNAGDIIMNNCTGMTLTSIGSKSYSYRIYEDIAGDHEVRLVNCIAINDNDATDKRDKNTGLPKPGEHGKYGQYGRFEVDETLDRLSVVNCEFQKADPEQFIDITNHQELMANRDESGEIPATTFAHLKENSFLVDAGVKVNPETYRGIEVAGIDYMGAVPDLGAYESSWGNQTGLRAVAQKDNDILVKVRQTASGLLLVTTDAPSDSKTSLVTIHDVDGSILANRVFAGNTTAIRVSKTHGMVIVSVTHQGKRGSVTSIIR